MTSVEETAVICACMKYGRLSERLRHPQPLHSASSLSQLVASNLLPAFHPSRLFHAMSSAGGLSRRRVPASTSTGDDDADNSWGFNGTASNRGGSQPVSRSESLHSPAVHAGSAFEGGSKIAYDPRDLEREDEDARLGGKPPRLTIMEEVLLLGLKDKQVSPS